MIGFSIAIPVGPIGLLLIRRTLTSGRMAGLVSGFGAATADAFYGAVAGFGLTLVSTFLLSHSTILRFIGGAFLCYLGGRIFVSKPLENTAIASESSLIGNYLSTAVLTLANPLTIVSFAALFAGFEAVATPGQPYLTGMLIFGVFCGSSIWWLILSFLVSFFHGRFNSGSILILNRIAGATIATFGLLMFSSIEIWAQ